MNFLIDTYDLFIRALAYIIMIPFTEGIIVAFVSLFLIKKMGFTKLFSVQLLSLTPTSPSDEGFKRNKRYRLFNDIFNLTLIFLIFVRLPLWGINKDLFFYKDYVNENTNDTYKLERDKLLEAAGMIGLPLFPYVWIPLVIGINKYRQSVGAETMVTWKFHDQRRECFWSGYKDSSCISAMDMARALHQDSESLEIGLKYVEAYKGGRQYNQCLTVNALRRHAEQTENIEMYKELAKKRCELNCNLGCEDHEYAQILPDYRLRNKFSQRSKPSSFLK